MKAFLLAVVVMIVVSAGAWYALDTLDWSSAERYSSEHVRL